MLPEAIVDCWGKPDLSYLQALYELAPRRLVRVLEKRGADQVLICECSFFSLFGLLVNFADEFKLCTLFCSVTYMSHVLELWSMLKVLF